MKCPMCNSEQVFVKDSRPWGRYIRRKRKCTSCNAVFYTMEVPEEVWEQLKKKGGDHNGRNQADATSGKGS